MLKRIIEWSAANRFIVIVFVAFAAAAGVVAMRQTPLEALPDLSDVQVIVQVDYDGQAPQIIEDQVTYPVASEMLKVPGAQTVRGYSFFGVSFVYVIFEDGTDLYWARSRVLENLSALQGKLPAGATAALGPDATGLGWIYQYVLEDTTGQRSLAELRALQDWYLRFQLTAVPGVSEVAAVGGFEKTYEVMVDPVKLRGYGVSVTDVMHAIQASNQDAGAMMMELSEREFMVRGLGYLKGIPDIESVPVGSTTSGTPIRVAEIATVREAPDVRRGLTDLDGRGDVVGGIVVMRFGENALGTIDRIKEKLSELEAGLPPGVVIRPVYDRSDLILSAISNLKEKLFEELIVVALVCLIFLFHARSALVAIITLPLGILMAFVAMRALGIGADIMSLGGIAIAIGAMIDAAIIMIENMHKHLERVVGAKQEQLRAAGASVPDDGRLHTSLLTERERWAVVVASAKEVGPALFFSLLIITVSFVPVFALEAQEGRLFKPLAWTKTLAMAAASLLSVTAVPVAMGLFIRGRIYPERRNPVSRLLMALYRPVIDFVLRFRLPVIAAALATLLLTWIPFQRIGGEFMPPLNEGTILYMPTTLPGFGLTRAHQALQRQDSILASFPEVVSVFGKAGRANTATDPSGFDMFETTIVLKPESEWRAGLTMEKLIHEMDEAVRFPGLTNSWTMPIQGRIDMLATGIRTPVGIKIFGPDLAELERIGKELEGHLQMVPGTRSAFAERAVSGFYVDVEIDRAAAARYGLNVQEIQDVLGAAVGGMTITQAVEGRERYPVRLRYPQELRDDPEKLADLLIPVAPARGGAAGAPVASGIPAGTAAMAGLRSGSAVMGGSLGKGAMTGAGGNHAPGGTTQIPLGQVATIRQVAGPMAIKTEGAFPTAWVYVDVEGRDIGGYVRDAKEMVEEMVTLPAGYTLQWSGQFEYMQRAKEKLMLVVPATLVVIFMLLYFNFKNIGEVLIVMLSLPFSLVGGVLIMALLGYHWSVATAVGFIALAGVAAETGVIMLIYLDHAWDARRAAGRTTLRDLYEAIVEGAVERVRPKMMTVTAIIAGLLPILWGSGTGASVMKRIAAPMVGGMVSSTVLTLVVIPAIYSLWKEWQVGRISGGPHDPGHRRSPAADHIPRSVVR
jgi:Cu(I)/Ag(I) efflux system membrane protein CusA/SilA